MNETYTNIEEYIQQTSLIINLPIDNDSLPGVVDNFVIIAQIARLVTEVELPETIESAPIFQP